MITINELLINDVATEISVDVDAGAGNLITEVNLYTIATYKDTALKIDLSGLLAGTQNEVFTISADDISLTKIEGLYFIEFVSNEISTQMGVASNFVSYHECLLNKTLAITVASCTAPECKDLEVNFITTLIDTLYDACILELFPSSVKINKALDVACRVCNTCPSTSDALLTSGLGIETTNNVIKII